MADAVVGEIGGGLCVLLGIGRGDRAGEAVRLAGKIARLRIFENEEGKLDQSVLDTGGGILVVSQFTLLADSRRQKGTGITTAFTRCRLSRTVYPMGGTA